MSREPAKAGKARGPARDRKQPVDLRLALVEAFLTNERVNQTLLDLLDPKVWRAAPPCSKRRNIATTFAHLHNVRCMRLKMSRAATIPDGLDRAEVTIDDARRALGASAAAMAELIGRSLETGGHVKEYRPDVVMLVCAEIAHEAHHRGQVCHWARELGAPIELVDQAKLWDWGKLWREVTA